ncbi:hypothetical protein [Methylotenera sp. 1P/1]|uniref:hypothetical protein n=1 Tax=Methylotenera sp. 1P/1 TaxID=1131551 RepID=UPI0003778F1B|nr:hypothetical protein [Methylotenera sp. 1P/1]
MAITREYKGAKLVKKTFYLEEADFKIFEEYAKKEGKGTAQLLRMVMSKYALIWGKKTTE